MGVYVCFRASTLAYSDAFFLCKLDENIIDREIITSVGQSYFSPTCRIYFFETSCCARRDSCVYIRDSGRRHSLYSPISTKIARVC